MHTHHEIDYIEFTVADMAEAQRFCREAFGWSFTGYAPTYAGINIGEREVGGLSRTETPRTGGPR